MGQVSSRLSGLFNNDHAKKNATKPNNEFQSKNISIFNNEVKHFDCNDSETLDISCGNDTSILKPISSFATPRLPLKRTREVSPVTVELPKKILDLISPCFKKLKMDDEHLNFPFLNDCKTLDYLRKCKILFIMRGIPGSGKSTITKHLSKMYTSMVICSADDFFMVDTEYQYDPKKIGDAHKYCKQKAVDAAVSETMVIIVDNTNTKFWEMKFYLALAKSFNYIPIIVEPKTPWKNDVKILVEKNTHNLDEDAITFKINNYEELNPLYYGWFINEKDSYLLSVEGQSWIEEAFMFSLFLKDMTSFSGVRNFNEFLETYKLPVNSPLFHVTSKYTAKKGNSTEISAYFERAEVKNAIGKVFDLEIVCFVITPRTFGARVKLSEEQEKLWGGDDDESIPSGFWNVCPQDTNCTIVDFPNSNCDFGNLKLSHDEKTDEILITNELENFEILEDTAKIALASKQSVVLCDRKCAEVNTKIISETNDNVISIQENGNCKTLDEIADLPENSASLLDSNNHNLSLNVIDAEQSLKNYNLEFDHIVIDNVVTDISKSANVFENYLETEQKSSKKLSLSNNKVSPIEVKSYHVNVDVATPFQSEMKMFSPVQRKSPNKNKSPNANKSLKNQDVLIPENDIKPTNSKVGSTIKEVHKINENKLHPTSGKGRRAHITLGYKTDVKPVTTGLDLLLAIELETQARDEVYEKELTNNLNASLVAQDPHESLNSSKSDIILPNKTLQHTLLLNGATATNYGHGVWVFYLEKVLVVSSLFNCQC